MLMLTACQRAECEFCEEKAWCETTEANDDDVEVCKDCMERLHECDWCGDEGPCTAKQVFGEKVYTCDDCLDAMKNGFN